MANSRPQCQQRTLVTNGEQPLTSNRGRFELPCRDLVVEKNVDLTERPILCFWKTEPTPNIAKQVCSGVEERALCSPVPSC